MIDGPVELDQDVSAAFQAAWAQIDYQLARRSYLGAEGDDA